MGFFAELKRRNVFRVGTAYLIGSWLLAQIAELLLETFNAPAWTMQFIAVTLIIGFPVAVFFAWAFELTPEGVKRESEIDRSQSITHKTGQKLNRGIIVILVLALVYFVWESRFTNTGPAPDSQQASEQTTNTESKTALSPDDSIDTVDAAEAEAPASRQSIAVLPFANRSRKEEDEFFVEGMHDDLLTNLAHIGSLKVISRTSVLRYKDTEKPIPEIAAELGVATILEGAVQRSGDTVRINVQLIDASTDEHLWAEIFDRQLNTDNLFAIQTEISGAIAAALEATLTEDEQAQISRKPTDNLAAYLAFIRGRQQEEKRTSAALQQAILEFRRAVELDPSFAKAWLGLADTLILSTIYGNLDKQAGIAEASAAIDLALEIDPLLGEAHTSRGTLLDNSFAPWADIEAEYKLGVELSPNYARAYHWYSNALRSQPARLADALTLGQKAVELDPMSAVIRSSLAGVYEALGEYKKAEAVYLEILKLDPEFVLAYTSLSAIYSDEYGRFDESLKWLKKSQKFDPESISIILAEFMSLVFVGESELAAESIRKMEIIDPDSPWILYSIMGQNVFEERYKAATEQANYLGNIPGFQWISGLVLAAAGDYTKARELMLWAEPGYLDPEQWQRLLTEQQTEACSIGWVLMQTGDESLGQDLIQQTITYLTDILPQYIKKTDRYSIQICYAALGDIDAALDAVETQVAHNHIAAFKYVQPSPTLKELRDEPRYIALQQQVEEKMASQRLVIEAMYANQKDKP